MHFFLLPSRQYNFEVNSPICSNSVCPVNICQTVRIAMPYASGQGQEWVFDILNQVNLRNELIKDLSTL